MSPTGMHKLQKAARAAVASGAAASVLSAATLAVCSKIEEGSAAGGLNGPSQWLWGEDEAYTRRATLRHTALGYAIHNSTSIMWATLHEYCFGRLDDSMPGKSVARHCVEAAMTTAGAYVVDYYLTPKRFQPGFEKHVGRTSMFAVYAAFAAGLALSAIARDRADRSRSRR
jgi:hypothetical protein